MCPKQGWEPCPKNTQAQSERQSYTRLQRSGFYQVPQQEFVVDSGASVHMVSRRDLNSAELEAMRTSRSPTVMTASGEVQTREEATVFVKELDLFVTVMLLEETPAVLFLWKLCEDHGYTTPGPAAKKHISSEMTRKLMALYPTLYRLWFLDYLRVLPHLHLHLRLHHLLHRSQYRRTEKTDILKIQCQKEVEVRMESFWGIPLHGSTTKIKNKNEGREEVQSDLLHDLTDWLQEFREILVDEDGPTKPRGNPEPKDRDTASSSH